MNDPQTHDLVLSLLLYVILPLWGVSGFVDWLCHRATKIHETSGYKESLLHACMGVQLGIPILMSMLFQMNVLVLLVCFLAWMSHEFVAHMDVHYTAPRREISIWEMHAHNYLATVPFYMVALVVVRNYSVFVDLVTLNWGGQMHLMLRTEPVGGASYLPAYLLFMTIFCYFPYIEELLRCLWYHRKNRV
jgi:hypothetical protein